MSHETAMAAVSFKDRSNSLANVVDWHFGKATSSPLARDRRRHFRIANELKQKFFG